jgi:hypothetical protein
MAAQMQAAGMQGFPNAAAQGQFNLQNMQGLQGMVQGGYMQQ